MKCVICRGDNIVLKEVLEHIEEGHNVIEFPVQALVCQNCGERYYDRKTMRYLEEMQEKAKSGALDLEPVGKVFQPVSSKN